MNDHDFDIINNDLEDDLNHNYWCPCPTTTTTLMPTRRRRRFLQEEEQQQGETWEIVYTSVVLLLMFIALVSDRIGADSVMITALTAFMAARIITVEEGLTGFSNEGLLTVLVLFVVAEGISKTGALDWYMGKLLGHPKTAASAQLRLMAPIAIVSAFLNNTPVVAVMIPIVQRWAKNIRISVQQLLIPLSFASILGGTCTLIGTSTNLVVAGLLNELYPDDPSINIGLFSLGQYGVPVALAGMTYILLASPFLLPGGAAATRRLQRNGGVSPLENDEDILLGARLTPWSPAAGRTVRRSGLRDTGGIYLVSVVRALTGHVHRAVSNDFVLNVGDILYFTGLVESFGEFCEEHGLEVITNEVETELPETEAEVEAAPDDSAAVNGDPGNAADSDPLSVPRLVENVSQLATVDEDDTLEGETIPVEIGITKESLLQADEAELLRTISRMADLIHGDAPSEDNPLAPTRQRRQVSDPLLLGREQSKIVVTKEKDLIVVGINSPDRQGLLLDISKGLHRLSLQLRHTEAAVVGDRSISIWRCDVSSDDKEEPHIPDVEEIWSVLSALLSENSGIEAIKKRGLRVIRARVTKDSRLVNKTAAEVEFRKSYKAAIVAVRSGGKYTTHALSSVRFNEGDVLILQASDDSSLLKRPPDDFYKDKEGMGSRSSSVQSLVNLVRRTKSSSALETADDKESEPPSESMNGAGDDSGHGDFYIPSGANSEDTLDMDVLVSDLELAQSRSASAGEDEETVWKDLQVLFRTDNDDESLGAAREFLTAMEVAPGANLIGSNVKQVGIQKLPDLFLVSIERPISKDDDRRRTPRIPIVSDAFSTGEHSDAGGSVRTENKSFVTIDPDEPLQAGDVLWFSGSASAVGDLRKIPGLVSFQQEEVDKIKERVHDRRLVQAVVSRKGPLVGKTVKETRFRTRYGAAVIAVHREGKRVHEHPGNVKLQAGDVLLLEAGSSFLAKATEHDRSFALLAEVEDSAPPRLRLLIPALIITAAMLVVYMAGWAPLLVSGLVASILMVLLGILSEQEARDAVNWEVYVTIAAAFGIGIALVNSGVAGAIAAFLVSIGTAIGLGGAGLLGAVYFATFLISNVVTNNAAAALIFPIAMDAAERTGTDVVLMSYTLMLGASASFMSPFGYTTNLLIYGPGGYKYTDFLVFGTPMQIVLWILSTAFLMMRPWYISWVATFVVLILVVVVRVCSASISFCPRKASGDRSKPERISD